MNLTSSPTEKFTPNTEQALYSKTGTRFFSGLMFAICGLAIYGWIAHIPYLKSVFPEWIAIQPNTIACFILLAAAMWLFPSRTPVTQKIILACLSTIILISFATYIPYVLNSNFNLNAFIPGIKNPEHMSILVSLNFVILCAGFFLMLGQPSQQKNAQYFFTVALIVPLLTILGYFYNVASLFKIHDFGAVSFISAILFLIFSFTALFSNPTPGITGVLGQQTPGSKLAAYLIPLAIGLPIIGGNLWLAGELAGLYNMRISIPFMVFFIILMLIPVIYGTTLWLNSLEKQLIEARQQAESATRAKSTFLASMSHEIRTPLNGVMGMADLLADTTVTSEQRNYINTIRLSGEAVLRVINDILDFSKIEAGHLEIEFIDFDLLKIINESIAIVTPRATQKRLKIHMFIEPSVPAWINSDPIRLNQVLINLLGNAIKFTDKGDILLTVTLLHSNKIRFEIADKGIGITPEVRKRLFKDFSQGDSSMTRKYGGTGLGLAISKRLVEYMGGNIGVDSIPQEGSKFWFTIHYNPTLPKTVAEISPYTSSPRASFHPDAKLLVAEDNDISQHVIETMLKKLGFTHVDIVSNGFEALTAHKKNHYDLIIMDCEMPEMNGFDATQKIRETNHRIPIIAMTAHALKGDKEKCLNAGMNDYISKPITQKDLSETLNRWLLTGTK